MKIRYLAILAALTVVGGMLAYGENEITQSTLLKVLNGNFSLTRNVNALQVDQTGDSSDYHIQSIAVTSVTVSVISDVVSNGVSFFRNLTTNEDYVVDITCTVRLKAGEAALFRLNPTNAITAQSIGGVTLLEAWINED